MELILVLVEAAGAVRIRMMMTMKETMMIRMMMMERMMRARILSV